MWTTSNPEGSCLPHHRRTTYLHFHPAMHPAPCIPAPNNSVLILRAGGCLPRADPPQPPEESNAPFLELAGPHGMRAFQAARPHPHLLHPAPRHPSLDRLLILPKCFLLLPLCRTSCAKPPQRPPPLRPPPHRQAAALCYLALAPGLAEGVTRQCLKHTHSEHTVPEETTTSLRSF